MKNDVGRQIVRNFHKTSQSYPRDVSRGGNEYACTFCVLDRRCKVLTMVGEQDSMTASRSTVVFRLDEQQPPLRGQQVAHLHRRLPDQLSRALLRGNSDPGAVSGLHTEQPLAASLGPQTAHFWPRARACSAATAVQCRHPHGTRSSGSLTDLGFA